jgi:cellulose synthase operon protein C
MAVVTRLLDGYVETSTPSPELNLLITAFTNETPVRERATAFFEELPMSICEQPFCATAYGYLQSKRGDLREAEKWFLKSIEGDPLRLSAWLGLFNVYVRQGRGGLDTIARRISEIDLSRVRGTGGEKMALSHFLRDSGQFDAAARYGYETIRANPNDSEVALLYFGLFMSSDAERMLPPVSTVAKDTWVTLQSDTDHLEFLIEDGPDRPTDNLYSPTHPFVVPAIGLRVGDSFSQTKPVGPNETWRVVGIKHKYLHMLHQMEHFNIRFPDATGLYTVPTKEHDISPILDQIRQFAERNRKIADLYIEQHYPLSVVVGAAGGEVTGLAQYVRSLGHDITTCHGNHPERVSAERIALQPPPGGAVLDLYTAWIATAFEMLAPLKALLGKLVVPRSVIDGFLELERDAGQMEGRDSMSVGYHDGQFIRETRTGDDARRLRVIIEGRRLDLETHCGVLPVEIPDDAPELARVITEKCGSHTLDAAFLAAQENRVLLSEDLYYRQYAEHACGQKTGIWLQAALNVARRRSILDRSVYAEMIIGLAICRHSHITLDDLTLRDVLRADDTERLHKFAAVAEFIGTRTAEVFSHVSVASKFLVSVWDLDLPEIRRQAASGIVLEKLLRYRSVDWRQIVEALRSEMVSQYRAREYLETWLQGHFLRA